ncbi:hypothetical protein CEXT_619701 [Caerostris extrusa]|uniref:Uncharacterized protein n=1 Tax=Caerostris extrusa TaxID=172846 RepID=A0AAV4M2I4_CAEEX|nr:hypothetical protein CEXT_619701 [Caerostris extrusa]
MDSAIYLERCMEGSGAGGILENHLSVRSWERYDLSSERDLPHLVKNEEVVGSPVLQHQIRGVYGVCPVACY